MDGGTSELDDFFGLAAAREAAAYWGHGPDAQLDLLCISENATYSLRDPGDQSLRDPGDQSLRDPGAGGRTVLRLNRPGYHSRAALESELRWTTALRAEGIVSTPAYLPTLAGAPVATLGEGSPVRHAVMFSFAEGAQPPPGSITAGMPAIGEIAARLHRHSRQWTPPEGFTRFSWDLPHSLGSSDQPGRWGDWRAGTAGARRPVLEAAELRLRQHLLAYGYGRSRYGLIHADLRATNLLMRAGAEVTVIDFDDCGLSWFTYDLAASVSFLEHRPELPELVAGWLEGYRRVGCLDSEDLAVIPALIMLRRLQLLAWSASHAETEMVRSLGPTFAEESAAVAERYLSGTLLT